VFKYLYRVLKSPDVIGYRSMEMDHTFAIDTPHADEARMRSLLRSPVQEVRRVADLMNAVRKTIVETRGVVRGEEKMSDLSPECLTT
jgi:hypothetical protein